MRSRGYYARVRDASQELFAPSDTVLARQMRRTILLVLVAALARGRPRRPGAPQATEPWATVNVCDTLASIPTRSASAASMPGLKRKSRMTHALPRAVPRRRAAGATSAAAPTRASSRRHAPRAARYDAGWTFEFKPPAAGGAYVLRGIVLFEWRAAARRGRVARERRDHRGRHHRAPRAREPGGLQRRAPARSPSAGAPNSRGSLVMTPVTPSASSAADRRGVVDRPHVEVAAGLAAAPRRAAA